jgi:hypothetical protein
MGPPGPGSSQYGSRYSMSRTCGPRDIISLVIPRLGDNMAYPIGHHDNPPIPKFGKIYKVFEHLFSLKRADLMHMFGWFFY